VGAAFVGFTVALSLTVAFVGFIVAFVDFTVAFVDFTVAFVDFTVAFVDFMVAFVGFVVVTVVFLVVAFGVIGSVGCPFALQTADMGGAHEYSYLFSPLFQIAIHVLRDLPMRS